MIEKTNFEVIIIGGGLAGLCCAIHLSKIGIDVALIEKQSYPHHKVCGEYISNEVLPYLDFLDIDVFEKGAKNITRFEVSDENGKILKTELPLGGFGMSRYCLDNLLYEKARSNIELIQTTVIDVEFRYGKFTVTTQQDTVFDADYVVGAYGKRSQLDKKLDRPFIQQKSQWLAVKAHYQFDMPADLVSLHNFKGGYCGLSKVENDHVNACYLTTYDSFKEIKDIDNFQEQVMSKNPHLAQFFKDANPVFEKPLTISQISFDTKSPVHEHIFMLGDSAGLIHPLCGNGMAMAIHSAKLFSEIFLKYKGSGSREALEKRYAKSWKKTFSYRLQTGKRIQRLLMRPSLLRTGFSVAKAFPSLLPKLISKTHGNPLK